MKIRGVDTDHRGEGRARCLPAATAMTELEGADEAHNLEADRTAKTVSSNQSCLLSGARGFGPC
jgi:hypothetical protein